MKENGVIQDEQQTSLKESSKLFGEIEEAVRNLTEREAEDKLKQIVEERKGLSYTPDWNTKILDIVNNSHTLS